MTTNESQELTEKVLNIKYALDKLNTQKDWLEEAVKLLETKHAELKKNNENYLKANKEFEARLEDLNKQIKAKQIELDNQKAEYKKEIDDKFKQIDEEKKRLERREQDVYAKETKVMKDEASNIEKTRSFERTALDLEMKERQLAVQEVEQKQKNDTLNTFDRALNIRNDELNIRESNLNKREQSMKERENTANMKYNDIKREWEQAQLLKQAVEHDRIVFEKEKNEHYYILKVLQEIQTRCITNVGEKITKDIIEDIKFRILPKDEPIPTPTITATEPITADEEQVTGETEDIVSEDSPEAITDKEDITPDISETETTEQEEADLPDRRADTKEGLIKRAKSLGINAMENRKPETIIKKIEEKQQ